MKIDENEIISSAISCLLAGSLAEAEALHLAEPDDQMLHGLHSHEASDPAKAPSAPRIQNHPNPTCMSRHHQIGQIRLIPVA